MEEIAFIKQNLLDIGCPLIQESEDLEQIKTLLTTPSDHKQHLIQWILQEVSDEVVEDVELNSKAKAFGFDFNTLTGWTMSLKVIKAKQVFSTVGDNGLRSSRHYLDFIHHGGFALPIQSSNGYLTWKLLNFLYLFWYSVSAIAYFSVKRQFFVKWTFLLSDSILMYFHDIFFKWE